jgi:uncharacterized ParB-like nuclease family protein
LVLDAHVALVETTELKRPEIDVPYSVVDFLNADVLANADAGNSPSLADTCQLRSVSLKAGQTNYIGSLGVQNSHRAILERGGFYAIQGCASSF